MDELKNILRTFLKANNLNCSLGEISNLKQIGEGGNGVVFSGELQGIEIRIKSVWVFHDVSYHADTVLLNLKAMPPFGIYEDDTLKRWEELAKAEEFKNESNFYRTFIPSEEAALVDNKFYVSRAEFDNSFAEVDGEVINLSEHEVSIRMRHLKEKSIFIGTHFNSFWHRENNKTCRNFLKKHNGGEGITEKIFLDFVWEIRRRKYEDRYE